MEFLNSRRPDLEIRANFIHQLTSYENHLVSQGAGPKTSKWTEVYEKTNEFENEELLLRNTYLNAQMGPFADFSAGGDRGRPAKVKWTDTDTREKPTLATVIEDPATDGGRTPAVPLGELVPIIKSRTHSRNNTHNASDNASTKGKEASTTKPARPLPRQHSAREEHPHAAIANDSDIRSQVASQIQVAAKRGGLPVGNGSKHEDTVRSQNFAGFEPAAKEPTAHRPRPDPKANTVGGGTTGKVADPVGRGAVAGSAGRDIKVNVNATRVNGGAKQHTKSGAGQPRTEAAEVVPKYNNFMREEAPAAKKSQVVYDSKVTESLNQMMGLSAAMNEKYGMYKEPKETPQPTKERKSETVTHIINQNNINNFIIQNPQNVEVIEYAAPKVQPVPSMKPAISVHETRVPPSDAIVKKVVQPKKVSKRHKSCRSHALPQRW